MSLTFNLTFTLVRCHFGSVEGAGGKIICKCILIVYYVSGNRWQIKKVLFYRHIQNHIECSFLLSDKNT